jgi:predicted nucleic acid-binding protein
MEKKKDKVFVDTNVLLYANVLNSALNKDAQQMLLQFRKEDSEVWISRQVIREYAAILTREGVSINAVKNDIERFMEFFEVADETWQTTSHFLELLTRYEVKGKQVHDANIVATMLTLGIKKLLTHNTTDFKRYEKEIEIISLTNA